MHLLTATNAEINLRAVLPDAVFVGGGDVRVRGCSADTRRLQPGDLFAAVRGTRDDGHARIGEALARGCSAILADRPLGEIAAGGCPVPLCYVEDAREAFGRVCHALAGDPSRSLKVVGITGTNGKTTTSCLVASVLHTAGHGVGVLGTLGYFDGRTCHEATHTTPPADRLADLLSQMVVHGCSHAVMEVSSHALDQSRTAGIAFDAACITNVRRDHLDYHGSLSKYRSAKMRLLDSLSAEGFAVFNADDPASAACLSGFAGPALTTGVHQPAEITATPLDRCRSEQTFLLTAGSETIPVRTRMIGTHHVYNCLAATAVGLAYGIDLATVARGLEAVDYVPGRLERIECGQPFAVYVDYAHTADALAGVLGALAEVTPGRVICVFGAGGNRDRRKRPRMGRAVEAGAERAILTTDNPRHEDPERIARDLLAGFRNPAAATVIADRAEAICRALAEAEPGDSVLIAGKGHETYQVVGDRRIDFDDRTVVRTLLEESRDPRYGSRQ